MKRYEYEKMNKAELIELCLNNQNLATTVESKDKEISELRKQNVQKTQAVKEEVSNQNEQQLKQLKNEFEKERKTFENERKGILNQYQQCEHNASVMEELARKALSRYQSLLKVLEGTVDTSAELFEYAELIFEQNKLNKGGN